MAIIPGSGAAVRMPFTSGHLQVHQWDSKIKRNIFFCRWLT